MTNEELISGERSNRAKGDKFPKFNKQAGNKNQQSFVFKLLPKLKNVKEHLKPWEEFFVHNNCGPDKDQQIICLNTTKDEKKSNIKKCPQCSENRKILRNKEDYKEKDIDIAEKRYAGERAYWPVYNLNERKKVEMLEVTGKALNKILFRFGGGDTGKTFKDLSNIFPKNGAINYALELTRTNSGQQSEYDFECLQDDKYALTAEDIRNIKETYFTPESCVTKMDAATIEAIVYGEVDLAPASSDPEDASHGTSAPAGDVASELSGLEELEGKNNPPARERSNTSAPAQRERPAPAQQSKKPSDEEDLLAAIEAEANK